jgi:uncharacterized membrane protein YkgB
MSLKQTSVLLSRVALFIIYFWFGLLKIIGLSPASGMVTELFGKTMAHMPLVSSMSPGLFVILFGVFEVIIGILFIIPGKERVAIYAFGAHMVTTMLPLLFLKSSIWSHLFVPTLEGQYIIKNIALIACALTILASLPSKPREEINPAIL